MVYFSMRHSRGLWSPLESCQAVFHRKTQLLLIERFSQGRGVEPHGGYAEIVQETERVRHERLSNSTAAKLGIDQDHGDPCHRAEHAGDRGPDQPLVPVGDKAAGRLHLKKPPPIRLGLIPPGLVLETHGYIEIVWRHGPDVEHEFLESPRTAVHGLWQKHI